DRARPGRGHRRGTARAGPPRPARHRRLPRPGGRRSSRRDRGGPRVELLTVEGLHTYYGEIAALRGVSLHVGEGEIVALLGSNGAGKTTTLRTISGLQRPRRGTVSFGGADITRARAHAIVAQGLGHVPEGRRIFPALTVEENLNMGGYLSRRDHAVLAARKQRVFDLFPRLGERRRQLGGLLSGGEQQMLAVGRALMNEPRLLALDEPSLGLSPVLVKAG